MDERRVVEAWARVLQLVAAAGAALFFAVFVSSWLFATQLRSAAHNYLVREVTSQVEEKLGQDAGGIVEAASRLSKLVDKQASGVSRELTMIVPPLVEKWLAEHCDCERTAPEATAFERLATDTASKWSKPRATQLKKRAEKLRDFARGYYDDRFGALLTELRIFAFSNAALFLFSFLILRFRPLRARTVVWPLSLLTLATIGAVYYWVAGQDWFWTILTNDYLGWMYLGVVGVLFLLLLHAGVVSDEL